MTFLKLRSGLLAVGLTMLIAACGGGSGGSILQPPGGGGSGGGTDTAKPTVSLALTDVTGAAKNVLVSGQPLTATAVVRDATGNPVSGVVVTFAADSALAVLTPSLGTALTNASGVATVQMAVASATSDGGAGTISASVSVNGTALTASQGFTATGVGTGGGSAVLGLALANSSGTPTTTIGVGQTLTATARLLDSAGKPISGVVITFSTNAALAAITPSSATALTDSSGIAIVQLAAASATAAGAGTLKASAPVGGGTLESSINFTVTGGGAGVPNLSLSLLDGSGLSTSTLRQGRPLTATAKVVDGSGAPVAGVVVKFATDSALALFSPVSGSVLTDSAGIARVQMSAASITAAGAATVTAATTVSGSATSGTLNYEVSAGKVVLDKLSSTASSISAYGTTSLSVQVLVDGVLTTTPVAVSFSSGCATSGKAVLPTTVQTVSGIASATYTDNGCAGADTVTVSAQGAASLSTVINVSPPTAANLQYQAAVPQTIYLKGTGLVEVSTVTFKLVDATGVPVAGRDILLDLDTRTGGIKLDGGDTAVTKKTAADGTVSVTVTAGSNPTPVFVKAQLVGGTLTSQSNRLTITTGLPTQDSFSLSVGAHNIEGWSYDGTTTSVRVIASDRLGNPVPDGTVINFISEGAQVNPSNCTAKDGTCSVTFVSSERRPTGDSEPTGRVSKGRITLLAYTLGEESFVDLNGDNLYQSGEPFSDLGDVFVDSNENGVYNGAAPNSEQYVPYGAAGSCAGTGTLGSYGDAVSKPNTCDSKWGRAHVRRHTVMILSGSKANVDTNSFSMSCSAGTTQTFEFMLYDENGNPMPAGTELAVANNLVKYRELGKADDSTAVVTLVNPSVLDSTNAGGTRHAFFVTIDKCATDPTGTFQLNVTTKANKVTTAISMRIN